MDRYLLSSVEVVVTKLKLKLLQILVFNKLITGLRIDIIIVLNS